MAYQVAGVQPMEPFMPDIKKLRHHAYLLQSGLCHYCELPTWEENPGPIAELLGVKPAQVRYLKCTAEHLKPQCDGGTNSQENIVAACIHCNSTRHKFKVPLPPESYRQHVQRRIAMGRWHPQILMSNRNLSAAPSGSKLGREAN